jgi:hypothetical protein
MKRAFYVKYRVYPLISLVWHSLALKLYARRCDRGAIALGLKLYNEGNYDAASNLFSKVVKDQVAGTGIKRYR